ncbi:hypothetical protein QMM25_14325 [Leptospira santarosai]|nr:hypothetical protein [Leptospira santarosai]
MKRFALSDMPEYGRYPSFLLSKEYTIAAVVLQPNCNTIKTDTRILENIKEPGLYFPQCLYDRIFLETLFVLQKDKNDFSNSKGEFFFEIKLRRIGSKIPRIETKILQLFPTNRFVVFILHSVFAFLGFCRA